MSAEINYKSKYMELRSKYMNDLDMAFRLGMEQGAQQAQQQQAAEQLAQQQQMDAIAAGGGQPGQPGAPGQEGGQPPGAGGPPGEEGGDPAQAAGDAMAGQPTELDQHISKLESMIAKSELFGKDPEIKKSLAGLVSMRKAELLAQQMKKSDNAIKGIVKALHKPAFKMSATAANNLSTSAKKAVSLQHKIVSDVMSKMESEEKRASKDIKDILEVEGITTKG